MYLKHIFTRQYGIALAAIECLEGLADKRLPEKSAYVKDIKGIVESAIIADYSAQTGIPIDKVDKEDLESNSPHYSMLREFTEQLEERFGAQHQVFDLERMLKISLPEDRIKQ